MVYVLIQKLPLLTQCDRHWHTSAHLSDGYFPFQPFDMVYWRYLTRLKLHIIRPTWRYSSAVVSVSFAALFICSQELNLLSSHRTITQDISKLYRAQFQPTPFRRKDGKLYYRRVIKIITSVFWATGHNPVDSIQHVNASNAKFIFHFNSVVSSPLHTTNV